MAYPVPAHKVLSTLIAVTKNEEVIPILLSKCTARIEEEPDQGGYGFDNTISYTLLLELPPDEYADMSGDLEGMELTINKYLPAISRSTPGHWIARDSFVLQMSQDASPVPADPKAVGRIWTPGMFRLFISHRSEEKETATFIKDKLITYGVSGFVAHEDIDVSEAWESEILNALRSMQALLVLVTNKLHKSVWCNQELGFALGINVPIVPICVDGKLPEGFIAQVQGKHTSSTDAHTVTEHVVDTLLKNDKTRKLMRECLIEALIHSRSYIDTSTLYARIAALPDLTKEETERMKAAFENTQVSTYGASHKIKALIQKHHPRWGKPKPPTDEEEIPF